MAGPVCSKCRTLRTQSLLQALGQQNPQHQLSALLWNHYSAQGFEATILFPGDLLLWSVWQLIRLKQDWQKMKDATETKKCPVTLSHKAAAVCSLHLQGDKHARKPLLQHKGLTQSRTLEGKEVSPQIDRSLSAMNTFLLSQVSEKLLG